MEDFDPKSAKHGTTILSDDIHPSFIRAFQQSLKFEDFREVPASWKDATTRVAGKVRSLQQLGDYWKLLWELSVSTPIPYVSSRALPEALISKENTRLRSYRFKLVVDGVELAKPVFLHGNPGGYTIRRIEMTEKVIYGKRLVFHGYLLVQDGLQLKPDEFRGILIRVKDVAVGYYDPTMLDYRFNEGPRNRWLTGEIFVTEGLEDALNIDRDSFNRFHPEFRAIQEHVHALLRPAFSDVYKEIKVRSNKKEQVRSAERRKSLLEAFQRTTGSKVSFKRAATKTTDADVQIKAKSNRTEIVVSNPENVPVKKSQRELATSLFAIFEVAIREKGVEKQREVFRQLVVELLSSKW